MGVVMPMNKGGKGLATKPLTKEDSTDIALFVRSSQDDMSGWNRQRIVDALLRETFIDRDTAEQISKDVEATIQSGSVKTITGPLIRELVNAKMLEMGLEEARRRCDELLSSGTEQLSVFGADAEPLNLLATYIVERVH